MGRFRVSEEGGGYAAESLALLYLVGTTKIEKDYFKAYTFGQQALSKSSSKLLSMTMACLELKDFKGHKSNELVAFEYLEKLVQEDDDPEAWFILGYIHFKKNKMKFAQMCLERAMKLGSKPARILLNGLDHFGNIDEETYREVEKKSKEEFSFIFLEKEEHKSGNIFKTLGKQKVYAKRVSMLDNEHMAYEGTACVIEWYVEPRRGRSSALEHFTELESADSTKMEELFKKIGEGAQIRNKTKFRKEGDSIFTFKVGQHRFLCFYKDKKWIITNAFFKTNDKLPPREKRKALSCKKDYLSRRKQGTYYPK